MPTAYVDVKPDIIRWLLTQTTEEQLGKAIMDNIYLWLDGSKKPTFNQVKEVSKKSNIPLGYFFLNKPPKDSPKIIEYRTVDSRQMHSPTRNLIDTIYEMEAVQDWMIRYRRNNGFDKVQVVGSMRSNIEVQAVVDAIRTDLELDVNWYEQLANSVASFSYIRNLLEEHGIIVMQNGIVGKNTHRPLDPIEFKGFTITNPWAPLIFINSADTHNSKIFTLLHEIAHVWIGEDDLYNDSYDNKTNHKKLEQICNAVAGEVLVPTERFIIKWAEIKARDEVSKIQSLAKYFNCSEYVIARRALDLDKIGHASYNEIVNRIAQIYSQSKVTKKSSGGDYYNTMRSRLDKNFATALYESVQRGDTTYTEAYRLTNTNRITFEKVMSKVGGI